jgi:hypothetical protein
VEVEIVALHRQQGDAIGQVRVEWRHGGLPCPTRYAYLSHTPFTIHCGLGVGGGGAGRGG